MPFSTNQASEAEREKPEQVTAEQEIGGPETGLFGALPMPAKADPRQLTRSNILAMQKAVGNRAVLRMLEQQKKASAPKPKSTSPTIMRDDDPPEVTPTKPKGAESGSTPPSDDFDESSLLEDDDDEPTGEEPVSSPGKASSGGMGDKNSVMASVALAILLSNMGKMPGSSGVGAMGGMGGMPGVGAMGGMPGVGGMGPKPFGMGMFPYGGLGMGMRPTGLFNPLTGLPYGFSMTPGSKPGSPGSNPITPPVPETPPKSSGLQSKLFKDLGITFPPSGGPSGMAGPGGMPSFGGISSSLFSKPDLSGEGIKSSLLKNPMLYKQMQGMGFEGGDPQDMLYNKGRHLVGLPRVGDDPGESIVPQPSQKKGQQGLFSGIPQQVVPTITSFAKIRSSKEVEERRKRDELQSTPLGQAQHVGEVVGQGLWDGAKTYATTVGKGAKRVGQHLLGTKEERARLTQQDKDFGLVTWEVLKNGPQSAWDVLKRLFLAGLIIAITKKIYNSLPEEVQDRINGSVLSVGGDVVAERVGARVGAKVSEKVAEQVAKKLGPKLAEKFSKEYAQKAQRYLIKKLAGRVGASVIASGPVGIALALASLEGTIAEAYEKSNDLKTKYPEFWEEAHAAGNFDLKYYLIADDVTALENRIRAELEAIAGRVIDDSVEKIKEQLRKVIPGLDFGGTLKPDGGVDGWFEAYGGLISGTISTSRNVEDSTKFDADGDLQVKLPYTKNNTGKLLMEKNLFKELTIAIEPDPNAFPPKTKIEVIIGGKAPRIKIYTTMPLLGEQMLEGTISEDGEIVLSTRIQKDLSGNKIVKKVAGILKYGVDTGWSIEAGGAELNLGGMFTGTIGLEKNEDGELEYSGEFKPVIKKVAEGPAKPYKTYNVPQKDVKFPVASLGGLANINAVAGVNANLRLNVKKPSIELEKAELSGKAAELMEGKLPDGELSVKLTGGGISGTAEGAASIGGEAAVEIPRVAQVASVDLRAVGGIRGSLGFDLGARARLGKDKKGENYELSASIDAEANSKAEFFMKLLSAAKVLSTEIFSYEPFGEKVWEMGKGSFKKPLASLKYTFGESSDEADSENAESPLDSNSMSSMAVEAGKNLITDGGRAIVNKIYRHWDTIHDVVLPHRGARKAMSSIGESGLDYGVGMMSEGMQQGGLSGASKTLVGGAISLPSAALHGAGHILSLPSKAGSSMSDYGSSMVEQSLAEPKSVSGFLQYAGGNIITATGAILKLLT